MAKDGSIALASNVFATDMGKLDAKFSERMSALFGSTPEKLESAKQVNEWCATHTK